MLSWPSHADFAVVRKPFKPALPTAAKYLVYDIETIRDSSLPPAELKPDGTEKFPGAAECQVVSIAALALDAEGGFLESYVYGDGKVLRYEDLHFEERAITQFASVVETNAGIALVSWNGRGFDMPVIAARLLAYGWPSPHYGQDYRYRFAKVSAGSHVDLCDQLSDYGGGTKGSLDSFARVIGLPGKSFGDGNSVGTMYASDFFEEIHFYCLTDVIQTAFLMGRFLVLNGKVPRGRHKEVVARNWELVETVFAGTAVNKGRLFLNREG